MCCTSVTCWQDTAMRGILTFLANVLSLENLAAGFPLLLLLSPCHTTYLIACVPLLQLFLKTFVSQYT